MVRKLDGLDSCIIGTCCRCGQEDVLLYSAEKIIQALINRDGMSWSSAEEYYCVNILGAWMGAGTPSFMEVYVDSSEIHSEDVVEVEVLHNRQSEDS